MSDDNKDEFLVKSSSRFDWQIQQPSTSGSASPPTNTHTQTDAENQQQAASFHQCAKMANLIQEGNKYTHNAAKKSDDAAE